MSTRDQKAINALAALPSLGKVSALMLVEAGIADVESLRSLGAIECYRRLRFHHGRRVTTNFLYALECAVRGLDWRRLDAAQKARLKSEAAAVDAGHAATSRRLPHSRQAVGGRAKR